MYVSFETEIFSPSFSFFSFFLFIFAKAASRKGWRDRKRCYYHREKVSRFDDKYNGRDAREMKSNFHSYPQFLDRRCDRILDNVVLHLVNETTFAIGGSPFVPPETSQKCFGRVSRNYSK